MFEDGTLDYLLWRATTDPVPGEILYERPREYRSGLAVTAGKTLRAAGLRCHVTGCQPYPYRCGSALCPICCDKTGKRIADGLTDVLTEAYLRGYLVAQVRLSEAHDWGTRLTEQSKRLRSGWTRLNNSRAIRDLYDDKLLIGTAKVWEVPVGREGWNMHAHVLLVCRDRAGADEACRVMTKTWASLLAKASRGAQSGTVYEKKPEKLAAYLAKHFRIHRPSKIDERLVIGQSVGIIDLLHVIETGFEAHPSSAASYLKPSEAARRYVEAVEGLKGMAWIKTGPKLRKVLELRR